VKDIHFFSTFWFYFTMLCGM